MAKYSVQHAEAASCRHSEVVEIHDSNTRNASWNMMLSQEELWEDPSIKMLLSAEIASGEAHSNGTFCL
jgi:hypothetical protein